MAKYFFDTNILVYTVDQYNAKKQQRAQTLLKGIAETDIPVISTQVLQEFYSALTTKLKVDTLVAKNLLHHFSKMETVLINPIIIEQGIDISILSQISFWDGLIVAAAESAGCGFIYSEDLNHGQSIRGIQIINPFK